MGTHVRPALAAAAAALTCLAACGSQGDGQASTPPPSSGAPASASPPSSSSTTETLPAVTPTPPTTAPLRPSGPPGQPGQLTVSESDSGRTAQMHPGDVLIVVLHGSAAAPWMSFASSNGAELRPDTSGAYGPPAGPGDVVGVFRAADRLGSSTITAARPVTGARFVLGVDVVGG